MAPKGDLTHSLLNWDAEPRDFKYPVRERERERERQIEREREIERERDL